MVLKPSIWKCSYLTTWFRLFKFITGLEPLHFSPPGTKYWCTAPESAELVNRSFCQHFFHPQIHKSIRLCLNWIGFWTHYMRYPDWPHWLPNYFELFSPFLLTILLTPTALGAAKFTQLRSLNFTGVGKPWNSFCSVHVIVLVDNCPPIVLATATLVQQHNQIRCPQCKTVPYLVDTYLGPRPCPEDFLAGSLENGWLYETLGVLWACSGWSCCTLCNGD